MASRKQIRVARRNIKKAQRKWSSMSHRQHALSQPQGRSRKKPGSTGKGEYYRIIIRPKSEFITFRAHDVGRKGHLIRITGKKSSGSWSTQSWLISKKDARKIKGKIIISNPQIKKAIAKLQSAPKQLKADIFTARPRKNIPESTKPTRAMRTAQKRNIKKAQAARWK